MVADCHAAARAFHAGGEFLLPADAENPRMDKDRVRNVNEIFGAVGHVALETIPQADRGPAVGLIERNLKRLDVGRFSPARPVTQPDVNVIILLADLKRPGPAASRPRSVGALGRRKHDRASSVVGPAVIGALQAATRDRPLRQPRAAVQTAVFERRGPSILIPEEGDPLIEYPPAEYAIRLQFSRFCRDVPEVFEVHLATSVRLHGTSPWRQ